MKSTFKAALSILLIIQILFFVSCSTENEIIVNSTENDIKSGIEKSINRAGTSGVVITMKNNYDIADKKIIAFAIEDKKYLGYCIIDKLSNGKLRLGGLGYGTNIFEDHVIRTNEGKYVVAIGRKYNTKVQYLKIELDGKKYVFDSEGQDFFIKSYMIPEKTKSEHATIFWFYDENNKDVTNRIKAVE